MARAITMAFAKANLVTTVKWRLLIQGNDEGGKEKLILLYIKMFLIGTMQNCVIQIIEHRLN